jgi:hypothetical protein
MRRITTKRSLGADEILNVMRYKSNIHKQKCDLSAKLARRRGFALAWTVLVIFALLLLVGLSIDTANLCLVNHQLHNAADAAALAGAPWVKKNPIYARELAKKFAEQNYAGHVNVNLSLNGDNLPNGDIIIGKYGYFEAEDKYLFIPYDPANPTTVNALAVIASRDLDQRDGHQATLQVPLIFGPLAGVFALDLAGNWQGKSGPYAIAVTGGGAGAGLICLRDDGTGLHVQGTGSLIVNNLTGDPNNGAIQVNSKDDVSITLNGTPAIIAETVNVCAEDFQQVGDFDLYENTDVWLGQPRMPDPLAWVNGYGSNESGESGLKPTDYIGMVPDPNRLSINIQNDSQVPAEPIPAGYYPGGFTFKAGTAANPIRLAGGVYILDGAGLQILSNSYVVVDPAGGDSNGDGIGEAFFYIASNNWEADGTCCYVSGNAVIKAQPLSDGPYAGIIIAQDDHNLNDAEITGTGESILEGTLYFPQERPASEQKTGNGQGFALRLGGTGLGTGNQVIASSVYVFGTGDKIVNYNGQNPSPIGNAWLVE